MSSIITAIEDYNVLVRDRVWIGELLLVLGGNLVI
jgi:hypothetical protein